MGRRRIEQSWLSVGAVFLALTVGLGGCQRQEEAGGSEWTAAVTTSYIEAALRDVAGDDIRIVRLLPPGSCPGHFDVTPRMIDSLRGSGLLLRFDFQQGLEDRLERLKSAGLEVIAVPSGAGLCVPETYESTCRAVRDALIETWPDRAEHFRTRFEATKLRLADLGREVHEQIRSADLHEAKVLCSRHQEAFCRWLGLDVVGTFPRGEDARIAEVIERIKQGKAQHVQFVVATFQEGLRVARRLADQIGTPMAVFSNFPSMAENQRTFDDLVWSNVGALIEAAKSASAGAPATSTGPSTLPDVGGAAS